MRIYIGTLILTLTIFSAIAFGQAGVGAKYIGFEYAGVVPSSTLSNGVKHLGGGMIGDINADPVYGISQLQKGRLKMLWLEESTGQDAGGVTGWKVLDVLSFQTPNSYIFFYGDPAIVCRRGGRDIENLVGVGRILRSQGVFRPSKLWIANISSKKFEPTSIRGVRCVYSEP